MLAGGAVPGGVDVAVQIHVAQLIVGDARPTLVHVTSIEAHPAIAPDSALVPARNATRIATIHPLILSIERASSVGSNQSSELEPK